MPLALLEEGGEMRRGTPIPIPIPPPPPPPIPVPIGLLMTASELIGMNGEVDGERCWSRYPLTAVMDGEANELVDVAEPKGNPLWFSSRVGQFTAGECDPVS